MYTLIVQYTMYISLHISASYEGNNHHGINYVITLKLRYLINLIITINQKYISNSTEDTIFI